MKTCPECGTETNGLIRENQTNRLACWRCFENSATNHEYLFLVSLTMDDLILLKEAGIKLSEKEEARLADFRRDVEEKPWNML